MSGHDTTADGMNEIDTTALVDRLASGDVRLVMTMTEDQFRRGHIPGSEHFSDVESAMHEIAPSETVVVYCSHAACAYSIRAYRALDAAGYDVLLYRSGLQGWVGAGGELVELT